MQRNYKMCLKNSILVLVFVLKLYTVSSFELSQVNTKEGNLQDVETVLNRENSKLMVFDTNDNEDSTEENMDVLKLFGGKFTPITDPPQLEASDDDGLPPAVRRIKQRYPEFKDAVYVAPLDKDVVKKMQESQDVFKKMQKIEDDLKNDPFLKIVNTELKPFEIGPVCESENRRYWSITTCLVGEHCCGCWKHKCCRPGQAVPDDDDKDKLYGTCKDVARGWVWAVVVFIVIVCSLISCMKRAAGPETQRPRTPTPSRSSNSKTLGRIILVIPKKGDKENLVDNQEA